MGRSITFLHVADLHIGAPVRGLRALDDEWSRRMRTAIVEAFDRVVQTAVSRQVDFVVIAGDVFDASRPSYGEYLHFFEGMQQLADANLPVYLIAGNHDPSTSWSQDAWRLPETAHLLGVNAPEFALFEREGEPLCLIGGRSYYNQTWPSDQDISAGITREAAELALAADYPSAAQAPFSIGVIHTSLGFDVTRAPTSEESLLASGIDYWACGHLHKRSVWPDERNPRIGFPGCIQGRDIKETGERGCYLVTLEEGALPQLEFVPTASVVLHSLEVDAGTPRTLTDLERHIQSELFRMNGLAKCEEMIARVTLVGATELHEFLCRPGILQSMRQHVNDSYPSFYCDALVNRTRPVDLLAVGGPGQAGVMGHASGSDLASGTGQVGGPALAGGIGLENESSLPGEHGLASADALLTGSEPATAHPFRSLVESMAADQRARDVEMINFVQSEFVKRGVAVPSSLTRRIGDFGDAAEQLVMDLLAQEESDAERDEPLGESELMEPWQAEDGESHE